MPSQATPGGAVWLWLLAALAVLFAAAAPFAPTWYDENYTQEMFIRHGPAQIFSDYHLPNNHILYSFGQWAWQQAVGPGLLENRLFPLLATALALPGLFLAGRHLHSIRAGVLAMLLFATSHVVANFSAQLRGYGLSLGLLGLALGAAVAWRADGYRCHRLALGFASSSAAAVAVMPTNALFVVLMAIWLVWLEPPWRHPHTTRTLCWLSAPALGFLAYIGVWHEFIGNATRAVWTTYPEFLWQVVRDLLLFDMPWSVPLLLVGIIQKSSPLLRRSSTALAVLLILALLAPGLGRVPWPRNYLPLVLLLCLSSGAVLALLLERSRWPATRTLVVAVAILATVVGARELLLGWDEPRRWRLASGRPDTLIDQFLRHPSYQPQATAAQLRRTRSQALIIIPAEVYWDMPEVFETIKREGSRTLCVLVRDSPICHHRGDTEVAVEEVVLVHWSDEGAKQIAHTLARGPLRDWGKPDLTLTDRGFFGIWSQSVRFTLQTAAP